MADESNYPTSFDTLTDKEAKKDKVSFSHINRIQNIIEAIEAELGLNPSGAQTDLVTRLGYMMQDTGAIVNGSSFPGSPIANQIFKRSDTDDIYHRNNANSNWIKLTSAYTLLSTTTFSAATDSGDITITGGRVYLVVFKLSSSGNGALSIRLNNDSGSNYNYIHNGYTAGANVNHTGVTSATEWVIYPTFGSGTLGGHFFLRPHYTDNTRAWVSAEVLTDADSGGGGAAGGVRKTVGNYDGSATITSFRLQSSGPNITGTIYVYEIAVT